MKNNLYKILNFLISKVAKLNIWRFRPKIIAITGSAGKTSAKEAIYSILKETGRVRRTSGNFNNELGVPLSIIGEYNKIWHPVIFFWGFVFLKGVFNLFMPKRFYPKILVLEYGADRSGDIANLVKIASPDVAVITSVGDIPVHVEFYPTGVGAVIKEKSKLISGLSVSDKVVLNFDDKNTFEMKDKTRAKIVGFGFSEKSKFKISNFSHTIEDRKIEGINFKIEENGSTIPISIKNAFSIGHAYSCAAAISTASLIGINPIESANYLTKNYIPVIGRSFISDGVKNTQIIDESYNSSPIALGIALKTLAGIKDNRRVAILGDMLELGGFTEKAHRVAGKISSESLDILITVGSRAKFIAKQAIKEGMKESTVFSYPEINEYSIKEIKNTIKKNDVVLVKGSRAIGLEKIIKELSI